MSFMRDDKFSEIFESVATADMYKQMAWRLHILDFFLQLSLKKSKSGAYVECGVFRGFKSYYLFKKTSSLMEDRKKILIDTFEGIDEQLSSDSPIRKIEHAKDELYDFVVSRFSKFPNTHVIKGSAPYVLSSFELEQVSFLHLDMNSWQAEIGALDYFLPKMSSGVIIVLDEFGLYSHRAQFEHEYPYFQNLGLPILELPTGQGVVSL